MITKVFAVYDSKADAYLPPMFFPTRGVAIRAFTAAVSDSSHDFHKYASDYTLFEIGSFDDSNACFSCHMTPVSLGLASEFAAAAAA